jgi:diadenylate cyclase
VSQFIADVRATLDRLDAAAFLDILIIATIIYALLMALRGTTAMTLLRGAVAMICLLFLLGRVLQLSVVNFLIRNSLPGLVLGVIVIFQPEIRRALERAGRTSIRSLLSNTELSASAEAVATAVIELSRHSHGAIIIVERSTGLEDYIESGVRIDAALTPQLLEGIFYPNSPLHDKAVIVRDQRIAAANCTLPLSEGPGSARLGTRHRAALGITERTDAISVVVSEESGAISVATDGRLIRLREDARIRPTLEALISGATIAIPSALAS